VTGDPLTIDRLPTPGAGFVWRLFGDSLTLVPQTDDVDAIFTTRVGGKSEGPFASWNMSYAVGDERDIVAFNRELANEAIGRAGATSWGRIKQVHGTDVVPWLADGELRPADGIWTQDPSHVLGAFGADCLPVLFTGPERIATAHAGWRGLVAGVIEAAAAAAGATRAWIGPGIGPCCYEVGEDVAAPFRDRFGEDAVAGRSADLWLSARRAAESVGVAEVHVAGLCTSCNEELFFSHRRDKGRTGRQALVAAIVR
jgi:YfiH family protein